MSKKVKNDPDNYSKMSLPHESEEAANNRLRLCAGRYIAWLCT